MDYETCGSVMAYQFRSRSGERSERGSKREAS
jgi:hypothetical protein